MSVLEQAERAVDSGHKKEARELLRQLLAVEPRNSYAWELFSYVAQGRDAEMDCLQRAVQYDPSNYTAWLELVKKVGAEKAKKFLPAGAPIPVKPAGPATAPTAEQVPVEAVKRGPGVLLAIAIIVALVGAGGGWYYYYGPCGIVVISNVSGQLGQILRRWNDALSLARSTSLISLSGPVGGLQSVERDTENMKVPDCLHSARLLLASSMTESINGFLAFMGQKTNPEVSGHFDNAGKEMAKFVAEYARIKACAPFCQIKTIDQLAASP
jgi:tetratricopeptide (TPR) repeat protein